MLGNAIQESGWLFTLKESGGSGARYAPWFGRGFLQLTWPDNYIGYWRFRGRNIPNALASALKTASQSANSSGSNAALQDSNFPTLTQEMKNWRQDIQADSQDAEPLHAPSDSAGYYWVTLKMANYADETHTLERKAVSTGQGNKMHYRSQAFWRASAAVNLLGAVNNSNYSGINGFDSRCCAYGVCLATLGDLMLFPNAQGQLATIFPESNNKRPLQ